MNLPLQFQIPIACGVAVFLLVLLAERLHERRMRVVGYLATGPTGQPRRWVRLVPLGKSLTLAAMAWAVATLWYTGGGVYSRRETPEDRRQDRHHLVFAADLSPSMQLADAGPDRNMRRSERMHEVVDAILRRIDGDVVYSVIGFYSDAMPVIIDAEDAELVRNAFDGLPIWYAMQVGKTDLGLGVRTTLDHLRDYPAGKTTLFVCTDGDTVPLEQIPKAPRAVRDVYVLGVGDPRQGTFIDGHMSRQDPVLLRTLAGRLGGRYLDVNEKHVPTLTLGMLAGGTRQSRDRLDLTDLAILVFAIGAALYALLPVLLEYFGSDWRAVRVPRSTTAGG
jgi:Ca-activated chloride channel homolog